MWDRGHALSSSVRTAGPWRRAGEILLLGAVYFVAARAGLGFASVHPSATPFWPPTGIALAAILLFGYRVWPGVALGALTVNVLTANSLLSSVGIAAGNTLEGLAGAWFVQRFAGGRDVVHSPQTLLRFVILAAGLATMVSATVGVTSLAVAGSAPWSRFGEIWTTWWIGDAMGALIVAPPVLLWLSTARPRRPRRLLEPLAAMALVLATGIGFFDGFGLTSAPIAWFWLPVIVWIAYRFGPRASATTVFVMSAVLVWTTTHGMGPFVLSSPNASILLLQAYLGVVSVLALALSSVVSARERVLEELTRVRGELEERVEDRTAALTRANSALRDEIRERLRLERELIGAGEHERRRLGWDLHDDLGQLLTGISFLSCAVESKLAARAPEEASKIREIRGLVDQAISKTQRLSQGLTPVSLGTGGLMTAIRELAEMTERVFDVTCAVDYEERVIVERPLAATNLYRIVQEAISNAVRHGGGRRIGISLALHPEGVTLTIADDGTGIVPGERERVGLGLSIMRYRAEMIGGTLDVRSDDGGTTVRCVVPGVAWRLPGEPAAAAEPETDGDGSRDPVTGRGHRGDLRVHQLGYQRAEQRQ